jgi:flagellin
MANIANSQTFKNTRELGKSARAQESSTRKLASGKRVNSASDDAATLSISTKLDATNRSRGQAHRNANDAISIVQTIEGSLGEINSSIIRIRELAIHSASDTVSDNERDLMNIELYQRLREIDRTSSTTELFSQKLTEGQDKRLEIQVDKGSGKKDRIFIQLDNLAHSSHALGIDNIDIKSQRHARHSLIQIDYALKSVGESVSRMGALASRFTSTISKLETDMITGKQANSRMMDTDYAQETANNLRIKMKKEAQTSVATQANDSLRSITKLI